MALNAWVDSFLPQSEKCGNERVNSEQGKAGFIRTNYTRWPPLRRRIKFIKHMNVTMLLTHLICCRR